MISAWTRSLAGWRLATKLVVLSVVLLLALQSAGYLAIRESIKRNAHGQLDERLEVAARVWQRLLDQRAAKLRQGASVLASDFGFRSALASNDNETITSALENHGGRIEASMSALMGTDFAVRAIGSRDAAPRADQSDRLAALAPVLARKGSTIAWIDGRPHQFVMVPVRAPVVIAWVVMGFELDQALLDDLHAVTGMDARLVALGVPGEVLPGPPGGPDAVGGERAARRVAVSQDGAARVELELSSPLDQAVAPYQALQWTLLLIAVLGLALFAVLNAWMARRVTQPLNGLVRASGRLGKGDYSAPIDQSGDGEVGELARAFDHMRQNIATQQDQIKQLAYRDRLTGLPNRAQFRDEVLAAIDEPSRGARLAVIMLDLDRFKHVNDVLGYASGDRLLQGVAARLQVVVREADTVARLGGDEFALLLPGADSMTAQEVAARITQAFEVPLTLDDQTVDLSAGLGIACWPEHGQDGDTLLSRAEVAMYAAKQHTAGAVIYQASLDDASGQNLSLLSALRRAIDANELRLFLQPKFRVQGSVLCGAEALVRWKHPERGLIPPGEFIPFAERTGFVRKLTLWIFEEVARRQAGLAAMGIEKVSINLSTRDLLDVDLPDKFAALLARHGANAESLCLEITESAIMDDPARAQGTLERLSQQGYKLSIDDFGTGYSSLAYLKQLPVNELKIDKSFVMAMQTDSSDAKIVRSTIELAHGLGLSVVAEGVENADILLSLGSWHCDEAQGFHLARPMDADVLGAWVEKRQAAATVG